MEKLSEVSLGGRILTINDRLALHEYVNCGRTNEFYVDSSAAADGDGSVESPFNNMQTVIDTINSGKYGSCLFYLMGSGIYKIPSSIRSISGPTPHFFSYNGSPTLFYDYDPTVTESGPCFYSCHVNIRGSEQYPIILDSSFGGVYFEGCSLSLGYVNVKCNLRIYGGSAHIYNCSFAHGDYSHKYGSVQAWLDFNFCNASINDCTFDLKLDYALNCYLSTVIRVYGDNTIMGAYPFVKVNSCCLFLSGTITELTWYADYFLTGEMSICQLADTTDDYFFNIATNVTNCLISFGRNYSYATGVKKGEKINFPNGATFYPATYGSGGNELYFTIQFPRILNKGVTITADSLTCSNMIMRAANGNIMTGSDPSVVGTLSVSTYDSYGATFKIEINSSLVASENEHIPGTIQFTNLEITGI